MVLIGSRVSADYLGAVANEFICNQWERKGLYKFIFLLSAIRDQRQMLFISL